MRVFRRPGTPERTERATCVCHSEVSGVTPPDHDPECDDYDCDYADDTRNATCVCPSEVT